jgi:hypothetical protein
MPTLLTWQYKGRDGQLDETQRCHPGDKGVDDILGEVTILSLDGGDLIVEDGTIENGKAKTMRRTAWHIKVLNQREAVAARAPTGRPGQQLGGMAAFLGASGSPVVHGKRPAANAKGLGGKAPKPAAKPAAPAAAAARGKRKEVQPTPPTQNAREGEADNTGDAAKP